ncbi:helix-turn-helix domain-containing protein [Oleiharenicola lentus]|uniref:helix-turn-helix domain-containing protein n=1 Tax=Oleiharenicola lentus TaxID=2508720 RepID=UPI003F669609
MSSDPFPVLAASDEETWHDARYRWDNSSRPDNDYCVVQRTLAGAVEFSMRGQRTLAGRNQAILFTHREVSTYGFPDGATEPYRLQFAAFDPKSLRPFFDTLRSEFGSVVTMHADGEAARLLDEIITLNRRKNFHDTAHVAELIFRLLLCLHREQVAAKQTDDPIEYGYYLLNDHASGRLSIKEIARLAGVTREYFIREYSRRYRETPGAALRVRRLERARALLLATTHPLEEIAARCGFGSADTLRRSFRQHLKKNPLDLRKA